MPMYEFKCPNCGVRTTELCKMDEKGEQLVCSGCGHVGLLRQISGFLSPGASGGNSSKSCSPGCHGNCAGCH